jgi:peptidoglycan L-alanyl-D-glutamate endopeptidase CwlK
MIDQRSAGVIATLLLKVQPVFTQCLIDLKKHFEQKGLDICYISGTRTYAEQDALYAKGRTTGGPIVTNARGGYSNHNFGIAVDCGLFLPNRYLEDTPFYRQIGDVVALHPELEWGGSWKSIQDEPHIQWRTSHTLAEMRDLHDAGRSVV